MTGTSVELDGQGAPNRRAAPPAPPRLPDPTRPLEPSGAAGGGAPASAAGTRRQRRARTAAGPSDRLLLPLVFLAGCGVVVARGPSVFLHASFWAEDGTDWYAGASTGRWWSDLFRPNAGYLQVVPRLVGDVTVHLPLIAAPLVFAVVAGVIQVLPAVVVASRRMARAVPDFRVRLVLALAILLAPGSVEVNANLTNTQWHLALVALLVVVATPATGAWRVFDVVAVVCSGLTGPFTLALVVAAAIVYVHRRQRWTLVLGLLAAAAAAAEVAVLLGPSDTRHSLVGATPAWLVDILGTRVVADAVVGTAVTLSRSYTGHLFAWSAAFLVLGAVVVGAAVARGPFELKVVNLYAGLVLAGSLVTPTAGSSSSQWQVLAHSPGIRYFYLPAVVLLVDALWLAGHLVWALRWSGVAAAILLVAFLALGVRGAARYPVLAAPSWAAQVHRYDRLPPGARYTFWIRPPGWRFTLTRQ